MARRYRIFITNLPFLILLESIDNLTLFKESGDYQYFLTQMRELSKKYLLNIHSYLLLENSIYFVATPQVKESLVKFMQSLARTYTTYYNKKYNRNGTVWAGRYKASLIEAKKYLLDAMLYIESLPNDPKNYPYSSIDKNLLDREDDLTIMHPIYKALGTNSTERSLNYAHLFKKRNKSQFRYIQECLEKHKIIGGSAFIKSIEDTIGRSLSTKKRGRPKKKFTQRRESMYKNLVVLDKMGDANLRLKEKRDVNYAKDLHFCPIVANELVYMAERFPVVFSGGERPQLVTLLSLGAQNLAINEEGKWVSSYIPLFIRRYPFALGKSSTNSEQKIVLIDKDSELFSLSEGERLFNEEGEATEILKSAIDFLTFYDDESRVTESIAKEIEESGILEEREITVEDGDVKRVLVDGFKVVDREKLHQLNDTLLADWVRRGVVNMIELHLKSLENIEKLFTLMRERQK